MQLFDQLFDILNRKNSDFCKGSEDDEFQSGYMLQRWLSMYSETLARLINNSTNILWSTINTKQDWHQILAVLIPQLPRKKIQYLKKNAEKRKTIKSDKCVLEVLANNIELSEKEIKEYIDSSDLTTKKLKKMLGIENEQS